MISNIFRARKPIFLANFYFLTSNHLARVLLLRLYFPANLKLEERAIKNIGFPIRSDEFVQRTLLIIERKDRASKLERERERGLLSSIRSIPRAKLSTAVDISRYEWAATATIFPSSCYAVSFFDGSPAHAIYLSREGERRQRPSDRSASLNPPPPSFRG